MDVFRMGRPDGKINALFALSFGQMCAQLFVNVIMGSLTEEILIQLADLKNFLFFGSCPLGRRLFLCCCFCRCGGFFCQLFFFYRCSFWCWFVFFLNNPHIIIIRKIFFRYINVVRFFIFSVTKDCRAFFLPRSLYNFRYLQIQSGFRPVKVLR